MFFNPPYSRHQKIADSFNSGKIEVYKSKSTSDIIEISTMDWLEQLVVIRWTIIWIGTPYLSGWVTCTNYQTFLLWKAWKHACNNLCVVRLFTLFHFFPAFKSEIGLEVTLLVTFCEDADYVSIPSFSSSIYLQPKSGQDCLKYLNGRFKNVENKNKNWNDLILTSDCLAGTSLSALHSLKNKNR